MVPRVRCPLGHSTVIIQTNLYLAGVGIEPTTLYLRIVLYQLSYPTNTVAVISFLDH